MTDLRKAAEMALEALENPHSGWIQREKNAREALRQALAQPEQEPVAWMLPDYGDVLSASEADGTGIYNIPLYTAPPKREWVGLTDEEIGDVYVAWDNTEGASFADFARLIETKSRSKNNG